jgi:hypothetical protein
MQRLRRPFPSSKIKENTIDTNIRRDNSNILIAITSCARDSNNGNNDAIRETYVKILNEYGYHYKFFMANGNFPGEFNSTYMDQYRRHMVDRPNDDKHEEIDYSKLKGDEIILNVDDSWAGMVFKIRESRRWAIENGYEFIFKIDCDTYLDVWRLNKSKFRNHDYWGEKSGDDHVYCGGWKGYMLSSKAYSLTIDCDIDNLCEDVWTSLIMEKNGINLSDWREEFSDGVTRVSPSLHGEFNLDFLYDFHQDCFRRSKYL